MDVKRLKNTELIKLCANDSSNHIAWFEFRSRFDERIWRVIIGEMKSRGIRSQVKETAEDLVQEVYNKLIMDDRKALHNFKGNSENSIFLYLTVIARNVVRNLIAYNEAQKRPNVDKSLDEPIRISDEWFVTTLKDLIQLPQSEMEEMDDIEELKHKVDCILNAALKGKNKDRDKMILKLHLYEQLTPEEVVEYLQDHLSKKSVLNIISKGLQKLRELWPSFLLYILGKLIIFSVLNSEYGWNTHIGS